MDVRKAAGKAFLAGFESKEGKRRGIGMESEHPIVRSDGTAGAIQPIFDRLAGAGWGPIVKGKKISGYKDPVTGSAIVPEAGSSTLEVNTPVAKNIQELDRVWGEVLERLLPAVSATGQKLLGLGVQPISGPKDLNWAPSPRYRALQRHFGGLDSVLTTASVQAHVDISSNEIGRVTTGMNLVSGPVLALTANAPFEAGGVSKMLTVRGASYDKIVSTGLPRTGIPPKTFKSCDDVVNYLLRMIYPFYPTGDEDGFSDWGGSFAGFLNKKSLSTPEEIRPHLLLHEGMWWAFGGRPRAMFGTAEFRSPCQQPPGEQMTVEAMILGLIENSADLEELTRIFSLSSWVEAKRIAPISGLNGSVHGISMRDLSKRLVCIADEGLRMRGMGEERYLQPLFDRVEGIAPIPAVRAREAFEKDGAAGLIAAFAL